ncbi:hypothetical protein DFJ74DRAFT_102472 [Hyaloraphidium curvatum]|nr:hypothetical protein DFJ74DRAFT_102472 [Hyaloraphidium curvatum]
MKSVSGVLTPGSPTGLQGREIRTDDAAVPCPTVNPLPRFFPNPRALPPVHQPVLPCLPTMSRPPRRKRAADADADPFEDDSAVKVKQEPGTTPKQAPAAAPAPVQKATKGSVPAAVFYAAVSKVYKRRAAEMDAAFERYSRARGELMRSVLGLPEREVEHAPGAEVEVAVVGEEVKRALLTASEKDRSLVELDRMLTSIRHEDGMRQLQQVAMKHIEASFERP